MTDGDDTRAKMIEVAAEASYLQNPFVGGSKFGPPIVTPWSRDIPTADWHVEKATRVVDALIAAFPVLTTEPNETPPSNEELALAWDAACDAIAVGEHHPEIAAVYQAQNAFRITQKAGVLAVAPTNPTDDEEIAAIYYGALKQAAEAGAEGEEWDAIGLRAVWNAARAVAVSTKDGRMNS